VTRSTRVSLFGGQKQPVICCLSYHSTYGLDVMVTRGSNTYGSTNIRNIPLSSPMRSTTSLPLYGDGLHARLAHVSDHAGLSSSARYGRAGEFYTSPVHELPNREWCDAVEALGKSWSW